MNAKKKFDHSNDLVFLPLGGTGEIGMNCYCYGVGPADDRSWLMVDLGVKFGEDTEPGIDVVLPDVGFIASDRRNLAGIVLTHAHEDHLGAVAWLWPQLQCPVYCSPFAAQILALKLKEAGLDEEVPVKVQARGFDVQGGAFRSRVRVGHTFHPRALGPADQDASRARCCIPATGRSTAARCWAVAWTRARLRQIGDAGVDVLVCDSTNVLREGHSPSEADVAATIERIVAEAKGRVAITTFASHVDRIATSVRAARAVGREVVVVGRAMRNTIEAARACGYLGDAGRFLDEEEFGYLPPDKILLLCTGSQGEPRAAIARIAEDQHPHVSLEPGDLVIFSSQHHPRQRKGSVAVSRTTLHGSTST